MIEPHFGQILKGGQMGVIEPHFGWKKKKKEKKRRGG
jgi:hypothetical protein